MEGKTVILSVLIMSLVLGKIQVEARKTSCCPDYSRRDLFTRCRYAGTTQINCARLVGCVLVDRGASCPGGYLSGNLQNSDHSVNGFCKLGCASSVCGALITLENSDTSEIGNGAVEKCSNACSTFCTKGSMAALETA